MLWIGLLLVAYYLAGLCLAPSFEVAAPFLAPATIFRARENHPSGGWTIA